MKNLILLSFLILVSLGVTAQQGTINGVVIDGAFNEPLIGGTVAVEGTGVGGITDFEGKYELQVNEGTFKITFSFIGYTTIVKEVTVKAGETVTIENVTLKEDAQVIGGDDGPIIVTATRIKASETAIVSLKADATSMVDGISADKISKTGDGNVAEATKRVTGVSVEGGKYVYVRGLGDRYSKTTLNGVEVPGLDPDRNSLQMDIFPTNLISNIVISKTFTADLPADFTGGLLNIDTKAFPESKKLSVSFGTSYNPRYHFNNNFLGYKGGATDFLGFDDGTRRLPAAANGALVPTPYTSGIQPAQVTNFIQKFNPTMAAESQMSILDFSGGVSYGNQIVLKNKDENDPEQRKLSYIFSFAYKSDFKHLSEVEYGEYQRRNEPTDYEMVLANRQTGSLSERSFLLGGLAGLAYKTKASTLKLTLLHLQNGVSKAGIFNIENNAGAVGQSGYEAISHNLEYNQRSLTNVLFSGQHTLAKKWDLDWKVAPTYSTSFDPDIRKTPFSYSGNTYAFKAGEAGNPSRIWRSLNEFNVASKIDLKKDFSINGFDLKLKFGGSHVYKLRNYEIKTYQILFQRSQDWTSADPNEVLSAENVYTGSNTNNASYIQSGNTRPNPNEYSSNVNNTAFYVSTDFTLFKKLKTTLGLRGEYFVQHHTGRDIAWASGDYVNGNNLVNTKVLESFNLFPSANFVYSVMPKMNLRASYSRTIARPSFKELSYAQILDPITGRTFNGSLFAYSRTSDGQTVVTWDGNLKETNIDNVDLRWEWFLPKGAQFFSVSGFFKNFQNPIELVRIPEQQTTPEYQPRNVGTGRVFGGEFEIRKNLDFIHKALENLTVSANLTLVYSEITMSDLEYNARKSFEREGENITRTRNMAGQSPWVVNAGMSYSNSKLGMSVGLFYNVKGPTLAIVGTGLYPDVYTAPFHSLNFSYSQKLGKNKNTSLSFNVSNLLDSKVESYYQSYNATPQLFSSVNPGFTFSFGVSHKFGFKDKDAE